MTEINDHDLLIKIDTTQTEIMKTLNNLAPVIAELQTDRTQNQVNIAHLQEEVRTLNGKSNLWDGINSALGIILAAVVAIFQFRN